MPTAKPFTFAGSIQTDSDNNVTGGVFFQGFPFLLNKVNVSVYDYWTTLGGFKKTDAGSPSQAQIDLSLANAMKLFWNLYGVTGTASVDYEAAINSYSNSIADVSVDDQPTSFDPMPSPKERVCSGRFIDARKRDTTSGILNISLTPTPVRLYNGLTSNEGNFVGYGMSIASLNSQAVNAFCIISLGYFADDETFFDYIDQSVGYVELYGMHFVADCQALSNLTDDGIEANITSSTSISPLSASMTVNSLLGQTYESDSSVKMTSLDFYTYT